MDAALSELTLACALEVEERAARRAGARAVRVGLSAGLPLPSGPLASFGLAGALVPGLLPGTLLTATAIVSEDGALLWEGAPLDVPGARQVVLCSIERVVDEPGERALLADRTGAVAVDMESSRLAASGRLTGVVRAISDTPGRRVGLLARAATAGGETRWATVARAFMTQPRSSVRAAADARQALRSLEQAAAALALGGPA